MLILTRKPGESLYIGDSVKVTIVEIKGNQIRVGIDAPTDLRIYREEIYLQILEENRTAAEAVRVADVGLQTLSDAWKGRKRAESEGSDAAGGGRPGVLLSTMSTRTVKRGESPLKAEPLKKGDPQVIVKRRRTKETDE